MASLKEAEEAARAAREELERSKQVHRQAAEVADRTRKIMQSNHILASYRYAMFGQR